jgi:segregation and condensation protein A
MAATLLFIKSQTCVDESEDAVRKELLKDQDFEITTTTQLIEKLEELQKFQRMGELMWNMPKRDHEIFVKPKVNRKEIADSILTPMDVESLTNTMMDLIRREKRKYQVVKRDKLSIKEKLISLKARLHVGDQVEFANLLENHGKDDTVITFISLLELARLKKLEIFQNDDAGNIYVNVKESLDNFNVETANGFEDENPVESVDEEMIQKAAEAAIMNPETTDTIQ